MEKRKQLRAQAMALPLSPGVYLMKDRRGTVIYVGKAKQLKNRVSQYFGSDTGHSAKVRRMVSLVDTFDYIVADSEFEALVLECSLIKQYAPKYNVLLKDDKGYRYIRVSPPPFSRISEAKQKQEDGATYIGPYMSSFGIRQAIDEASRVFGLSTCNRTLCYGRKPLPTERPCLNHHIGQCCAPCTGRVTEAEYAERVENALDFILQGSSAMIASLEQRMNAAAEALEFERAAELRDRIAAIRRMSDRQKVVMSRVPEQDVIAAVASGDRVCAEVFRFQGGSLTDKEEFVWDEAENTPAFRTEFISRYYSLRDRIPPQITVDGDVEDAELLERWLTEKAGRRVHIVQPQIGQQAQLTEMCRKNAAEHLARQTGMSGRETAALDELARLLDLSAPPHRIECYDISNTAGSDNVAGMVVYLDGKPAKAEYRLFKIQSIIGQDDYGSMREVISRRILEYEANRGEESGFGQMPDLILLDGGNEHVSAVKPLLDAAGWTVPLYGLVKDDKHRTRAIAHGGGETAIRSNRACFTLLSSIQEEVHRFAIGYHRRSRSKSNIRTSLTAIEGIGPTRAAELLRVFGSVKAISRATVEQLLTVRGMTRPAAEAVVRALQQKENENGTDSIG